MRYIYAKRLFLLASTLLISNVLFSNTFENKINNNSPIKVNSISTNLVNEHFELAKVVTGPTINIQPQNTIKCTVTPATIIKNGMVKIIILIHYHQAYIIM